VLATTVPPEVCTDTELLEAYQEQHVTGEPGFRWIKTPAAISPLWLEKPERIAALAMRTVVGLWMYAVIQRQVRLYLRAHDRPVPGNQGPTATPTAAVVFALLTPVMLVQFAIDNTPSFQVHGVQDYHLLVREAVGMDQAWYHGVVPGKKFAPVDPTPLNVGPTSCCPPLANTPLWNTVGASHLETSRCHASAPAAGAGPLAGHG
jgi:hypothetical protein